MPSAQARLKPHVETHHAHPPPNAVQEGAALPSHSISIPLPRWSEELLKNQQQPMPDPEERMRLAITIARINIEHHGGPFGAAIFDMENHRLVAIGMNRVVASHCSIAHAEMVAIAAAQQQLQHFDLASQGRSYELVSSCEPCAMCFGAIPWSGIRQLQCGARDEDARAIGFDEGPKAIDWQQSLEQRGIHVITETCRRDAAALLRYYAAQNGIIYNGRGNH